MGDIFPELQEHIEGLEFAKQEVPDIIRGLTPEQFNWRAQEGTWSVGECIDHLYKTGFHLTEPLKDAVEKAQREGRTAAGPFKYGFLGSWFVNAASIPKDPDKGKFKAPKLYVPASDLDAEDLIPKFLLLQDDFIEITRAANGLDLKKIKVASPALNILRLSIGLWLKLIPNHQKRHFLQARRVLDAMPSD